MKEFRAIAQEEQVYCQNVGGLWEVSFQIKEEVPAAIEIDHLCESSGIWLLSMRKLSNMKSNFGVTPQILPIQWHAAVMELLKGLSNDCRQRPVQTFLELGKMLESVKCYKLSVGKLDDMGEHICSL